MGRFWGLLLAVLLPTIAFAGGPTNPPGPIPTTCVGGNSFTAYPGYGSAPTCGGALTTGTVNVGDAPQIAQYVGAASVLLGPATVSGDGALATGGALTISKIGGKAVTLGGDLTTTGIGAITLAFPATTQTFTFPTTSKTLMATDYSNAAATTLGSTALTMGGTTATIAGLTLTAPTINAGALSGTFTGSPTLSGNPTFSGIPLFTGLGAGTVATGKFLGLDSGNTLVTSALPAATTSVAGIAKLHNVPVSTGWVAGVNPNNVTIAIINQASTISAVIGDVETATGSTATVSVVSAPSGTACSAGTVLHSGSFNANGTAATNQTLTLTTTTIAAGSRLCLQTTGTTSWTGGTGIGGITVFLAPT